MPSPYRLNDEEAIFNEAIAISDTAERARYLDGACRGDANLRSRLEVLLKAQFESVQFMEAEETTASREQEGSVIGPYKLLQQIGEGGFGVVYMAEQKEPMRRRVALKIIKLGMDTKQVIARFEAERQALAMMDHPNIAKVLDAGATDSGRPYFVMELVRGVAVTEYCDEHKLSTKERLKLYVLICQAIQHAHQKGVIHRDIKPSNVLISQLDGQATPKIIDFGVAKATQNDLTDKTLFTRFEQFIGTPAYMSPEQAGIGALDIDTRSDVYALGVLLYELLTGSTPLDAKKLRETAVDELRRRIREEEAVRPSARVSTMDDITRNTTAERRKVAPQKLSRQMEGDLDWIVLKALEKDRARRYETANALAQDVQRFMRNDPVDAMKPSLGYHFKKFAKRHRSAIATVAAFAMVLVLGTVVSVGQAIRAKREGSKAQQSYQEALDAKLQAKGAEETERVLRKEAESNAYTANMRLLQYDWENGNYTRIYDILNRQRDYAKKGFEWGYWQRTLHLETSGFLTHAGGIRSINVSAQGDRAALVMADGTIEVRSIPDGHEIVKIAGHPHWAGKAIFSPDGTMIASNGGKLFSGRVTLWNATTGEKIRFMGAPGEGGARSTEPGFIGYRQYALAFSPDGRWLATGGAHSRFGIQLWDVATGNRVGSLGEDWVGRPWIKHLAFTKDGSRLLCRADEAPYLALYDVEASKRLASIGTPEAPESVTAMSLSPQSNLLAVTLEEEIVVYDLTGDNFSNPRNTLTELPRHRGAVFSPNEKWLVLKSGDDALVYEANSGNYVKTIHGAGARTTFLPESDQMLSASKRWLKRWDVEAYQLAKVINARHPIVALAKDGSEAMVLREDADPVDSAIVDLATGQVKAPLSALAPVGGRITVEGTRYGIDGAAFSPDGRLVAYGARDGTIRVFNTEGDLQRVIDTPGTRRVPYHYALAFGPSGQTVISVDRADADESIAIWNVATGTKIFRTKEPADRFALTQDEAMLASASGEMVTLWDVASGEQLLPPWKALDREEFVAVASMAFTPDGKHLITAGAGGSITKWDSKTGELLRRFIGHTSAVAKIVVFPDGRRLASVCQANDNTVRIWDLDQGNELLSLTHPLLKGYRLPKLATSSGGARLVLTMPGRTDAIIWDIASEGQIEQWKAEEEVDVK